MSIPKIFIDSYITSDVHYQAIVTKDINLQSSITNQVTLRSKIPVTMQRDISLVSAWVVKV